MDERIQAGEMIRLLRKTDGMSQADLAEGICTQAEISRIERNITVPSADTLFRISERLGVDLNFFFEVKKTSKLNYIEETFSLLRKFIEDKNYKEAALILDAERQNPLMRKPPYWQFFQWHEGLVEFYVNNNFHKAVSLLEKALKIYEPDIHLTETQLQILISLGNIYGERRMFDEAFSCYEKCRSGYQKLTRIQNYQIQIRLLYNMALTLNNADKIQEAAEVCQEGITLCRESRSFYLFGEFYYQYSYSSRCLGRTHMAIEYLKKAITIFEITGNETSKAFAEKEIQDIITETENV
ncbi:helix-turn-helix transcriptional regulator [Evansella sp. LMS18]|uniref:helix-turn-helix domain-containing protein n=1 Tax=Evansella sp. LMS18 TaxID=2924033 RepID=UPI0020D193DA|nr:helix-turn-helix domain-containing protein [Evansella sp. LMS18]UTR09121.1 helix-turn-helix transcriptional regulator [Evansella sp. LMS18]